MTLALLHVGESGICSGSLPLVEDDLQIDCGQLIPLRSSIAGRVETALGQSRDSFFISSVAD